MKTNSSVSLLFSLILPVFLLSCNPSGKEAAREGESHEDEAFDYAIVLHGGAGNMNFENLPEERRVLFEQALDSALNIGLAILSTNGAGGGGSSLDAVEQVIRYLEDNPLFNAGRGAVFTSEGRNELDASIMSGKDMQAGAVAGVSNIRHPITAARAVMEQSEHVLLSGRGASGFAKEKGLEIVDPSFFHTEKRMKALLKALEDEKHGTVGCVALDREGNLCAGTSTGGMTNKKWGRIGDSPIIGAGTWADNTTCGVSGTGHGEFFIRHAVAHDIAALMEYQGLSVKEAARRVVEEKLAEAGGSGGVICLDAKGHAAMITNTTGMFRAYGNSEGERLVAVFTDRPLP